MDVQELNSLLKVAGYSNPNMAKLISGELQPSWIRLPNNWYSGPWFAAKSAKFAFPAWVLFDGDSVTNGVNPANNGFLATGWPDQLRTLFLNSSGASVYGDFYSGWSYNSGAGATNPVAEGFPAFSGGSTTYEGGFGTVLAPSGGLVWIQTIDTSQIPGWTNGNCTGFDFLHYDWGACTWQFLIDGGKGGSPTVTGATWNGSAWVVTNTGGGATTGNVKKVVVRGLSSGTHTIQWGQISSAGNMIPIGVSLFTGRSNGVGFVRSAYSGRRAVDAATPAGTNLGYAATVTSFPSDKASLWSGSGPANGTAQITPTPFGFPTQPSLAFLAYGINDAANYISPEAYGDALERKIIAYRRGVSGCNVCLIAFSYPDPHNSDNNLSGNGNRYNRWKRVMAAVAESYNCAYVDIDAKWGGTPVAQGFQVSGNVHPTKAGSADIANTIASII